MPSQKPSSEGISALLPTDQGEAKPEAMNQLAYVCLTSARSGFKGVLYKMTKADAKKLTSHDRAAGRNWMAFWTSVENYEADHVKWIKDDGRFDDLIDELQVTKLYFKGSKSRLGNY
jgi:hypothetical protein